MFSRASRSGGRHARSNRSGPDRAGRQPAPVDGAGGEADSRPAGRAAPPTGPYDAASAPGGVDRLDLGSLRIPAVPGVEVRVQAGPDGAVQQVFLVDGESTLQLGAFAAPRTEPIWDEVRDEIRASLAGDATAATESAGPYGVELRARIRTPKGPRDIRFVGVTGPRWLLRAVYQGPAAADPARAGRLDECLRGVVVDRGDEARPIKEPLPLRLAPELAARIPGAGAGAEPARS